MGNSVYVIGVGMVKVGRHYWDGLRELFVKSALKAMEEIKELKVDAIIVSNMTSSSLSEQDNLGALIADHMGLKGLPSFKIEAAGASGGIAVQLAYTLIASRIYDVVLVGGVEKLTEYPTRSVIRATSQALDSEYELYYGVTLPTIGALSMREYMVKNRVTRDDVSEWPVLMHEHGSKNPYAQLQFKIRKEQVRKAPIISDPLTLMDMSPVGDGAAAVILASEDVAKKLTDTPVKIAGFASSTDKVYVASREDLTSLNAVRDAAIKAYSMAGVTSKDVDVAEVGDIFSIAGIISVEELGFSEKGMAVKDLLDGRFRAGDRPTINPSGGLKARGDPIGATGVYQIAEVVMQLRGDFPGVKVDGEIGVAECIGGFGSTASVVVLKR